ncbi:MAG: hypothetical protein GY804_05925 [Alphaproteobacteria bacterium]|nr:hypothetical protein [Alphaproteobacteria bacterium]
MLLETRQKTETNVINSILNMSQLDGGFDLLYLNLSKLSYSLDDIKLKLIARMFEPLKMTSHCQFYVLQNGDIILAGVDMPRPKISLIIKHISSMFSYDPFVSKNDKLHHWHDRHDVKALCERISKIYREVKKNNADGFVTDEKAIQQKLTSSHISSAIAMLEKINAAKFVRRQNALQIQEGEDISVAYSEYFVSIIELSKSISPSIYLYSPRWLFQHFTQMLDTKMLGMLATRMGGLSQNVNLNLNIPVIFSTAFERFLEANHGNRKIAAEVQLKDVLRNVTEYHSAKDLLHDRGCEVTIDRIDYLVLQMMDLHSLEADHVKLFWNDSIIHVNSDYNLKKAIDRIGVNKIILAHCDGAQAVEWGKKMGISKFQGYYIDAVEAGMIKSGTFADGSPASYRSKNTEGSLLR